MTKPGNVRRMRAADIPTSDILDFVLRAANVGVNAGRVVGWSAEKRALEDEINALRPVEPAKHAPATPPP